MRGITKEFAGVQALRGVDLEVVAARCTACSARTERASRRSSRSSRAPTSPGGEIFWQGEQVEIPNPVAAIEMGVATMYQELDVVDGLTIAENIFLGHELETGGVLHRARGPPARPASCSKRLGHGNLSPHREVGTLSAANKQIVSMARALSHDAKLIIMDEPSAVLDAEEVKNLFRVVEELTVAGHRDHLHLAPSRRDPPDRRPHHGASRTARAWRAASRSPTPRRPNSSAS